MKECHLQWWQICKYPPPYPLRNESSGGRELAARDDDAIRRGGGASWRRGTSPTASLSAAFSPVSRGAEEAGSRGVWGDAGGGVRAHGVHLPIPPGPAPTPLPVPAARLPCGSCGAILAVPPGLARCGCPVCGAELAVDPARLCQYLLSTAAAPLVPVSLPPVMRKCPIPAVLGFRLPPPPLDL
ncbi:hypothetical protein SETIT_5G262800v2 [Setaria italica]|uniref:FORGETTER1 second zinc ribbon domain-containing protein n=1 Tax=Setaria italica TaxID=4555 RepID=K3XMD4_SETIT|nr:hypothetical protein SETIT_5G262800v2 [Setaria italica]RCV26648.1 hypothetical protein SETIT_5G262800v2 [Setaria italica]RCV26649.1 hypothetical protein SETIT_5G262800v2 [Setaria italica]